MKTKTKISKALVFKLTLLALVLTAILTAFFYTPVQSFAVASENHEEDYLVTVPYETVTGGPEGSLVTTQPAYVPKNVFSVAVVTSEGDITPTKAEDMAVDESTQSVYIVDSGKKRVLITDYSGNVKGTMGEDLLRGPMGIAVDDERVYVCDRLEKCVYIFDKTTQELIENGKIVRPNNPLIGKNTDFVPVKIAVDGRDNMYIVSEGSVSGLMQINLNNEFVGYIGSNETEVSIVTILQNLFFSSEQKSIFLAAPRSPTGVTIDYRGLVYTVTSNAKNSVKKLNTLGNSILSPSQNFSATCAACVDKSENIYTVQSDGYITIFDSEGSLLFRFGGSRDDRFGSLSNPVSIKVLDDGKIMVLDKKSSNVVTYGRTEFSKLVFKAVDYYKDGLYLDGAPYWEEVLQHNSSFILSYRALARASMKVEDYDLALSQFKYAEDKQGYSEAFWQIRNEWLENNLIWVIVAALVVVAIVVALKIVDKKTKLLVPVKEKLGLVKNAHIKNVYLFKELKHAKRFRKQTPEAVYEMKYHNAASVWTALILYVWLIVLQILSVYVTGYLFNNNSVYDTNGWSMILIISGSFLLLVLCNYFVSTVSDGEGKLKHCFITFIYALSPYLLMALPVFIITNVLTYNESIVYYILEIVMYGWSAICLFRAIMELHDYTAWQAIKNILLTIFAFLMAILFVVVLRMLLTQLFGYIGAVFEEVFNNVF